MAKKDKPNEQLLKQARERWKRATDADRENRRMAIEDMKFLHEPGAQWDEDTKRERGNRPCFEFNKTRVSAKRIINAIRSNRPQGKVRAVEDGDKNDSNVAEGLCRNIWNVSEGDAAVDNAAEYQVGGGMGAWRLNTKYSTDDAWDQDLTVDAIRNPFALWPDPNGRDSMKRDAEYWFLESRISKDAYKTKYGKVEAIEWESSEFDDDDEWEDDDQVRICEYWYKHPITKTLALLSDGSTIDVATTPANALGDRQIMRTREVKTSKICMVIMSGDKVLEGPTDWVGSKFPFVMVHGEQIVLDGKTKWWGLARHAKDAQRLHNAMLTNACETAALAPQAKWWATPTQALGNTDNWARAHKENLPFLLSNPDPQVPGFPQQMNGAQIPAAFVQLAMVTSEELKGTIGIFDPSLGDKTNAVSGVAKRSEITQGEIATYNYQDNIARGVRYTWELMLDAIPKIFDTERTVRTIGTDGAEEYVRLNSMGPNGERINDLSNAKYDVTVTVGPSFSTQRQEAAEIYMGLAQANPMVMGVAGDLIFKSLDLPYAEDMAERMQTMLPPQVQQQIAAKKQNGGKPMPPEVQAAMAQADQAMQQVQMHGQMVEQASQEVEQSKQEAEKVKSEAQAAIAALKTEQANLKTAKAELDAYIAEKNAEFIQREMQMESVGKDVQHQADAMEQNAVNQGEQGAASIVQEALKAVGEQIAKLEKAVADNKQQAPIVIGGGNRTFRAKRINGELVGESTEV